MTRIDLSLSRISRLLAHLPPPSWKAVHIAGTNGKGSVAAYLTTLLRRNVRYYDSTEKDFEVADDEFRKLGVQQDHFRSDPIISPQKFNVGRFTSPHFIDRWDCITVNNQSVSKDLFLEVEAEVKQKANDIQVELQELRSQGPDRDAKHNAQDDTITPFELLTATAFSIFTKARVHVAVIECGLGGRLDATNAMQDSNIALSIITRIGLDHINLLGSTIEDITKEKSGIFRAGVPIVADDENEAPVKAVIEAESKIRKGGSLSFASWHKLELNLLERGPDLAHNATNHEGTLASKLIADDMMPHQRANWAIAITALRTLAKQRQEGRLSPHLHFSDFAASAKSQLVQADLLEEAHHSYPGRLQSLQPLWTRSIRQTDLSALENAHVLVDGAHNAQSAMVLRDYVDKIMSQAKDNKTQYRIFWILAMSQGKDVKEILRILVQPRDDLVLCEFGAVDGMPWVKSHSASVLINAANQLDTRVASLEAYSNILLALEKIAPRVQETSQCGVKPIVVVAGSLYLVSDLLRVMREGSYVDQDYQP